MDFGVPAYDTIRRKDDNILEIIPFSSRRKRATTAVRHPEDPNKVRVFTKGAPEIVMDFCDKAFDSAGNIIDLSESEKQKIIDDIVQKTFAVKAYRTLLLCY